MSNLEYVRVAADKYGWKKYYSLERPVGIGTCPKSGMMDFVNYDNRTEIQMGDSVVRAWAEVYYNRELTDREMEDYELIKG